MSRLKGIDISSWQDPSKINYDLLASQIDFAILRASYTGYGGAGDKVYPDKHFNKHYNELKKRGVKLGAYHYGCANTVAKAINEARFFISVIKDKEFEMPVYYDTEDTHHQAKLSKSALSQVVRAFCTTLESEKYFCGVYASYSWFKNHLHLDQVKRFTLWVAHWGVSVAPPSIGADIWQYTSSGKLNGYSGNLDMNWAYRDFPSLLSKGGFNNLVKKEEPKPLDIEEIKRILQNIQIHLAAIDSLREELEDHYVFDYK